MLSPERVESETYYIPTIQFSKTFTFWGTSDQVGDIFISPNGKLVVGGWYDDASYSTAFRNFSFSGDTLWTSRDVEPQLLLGGQSAFTSSRFYYTGSGVGGNFLFIRTLDGAFVSSQPIASRMDMVRYGDSIVAMTRESSSKILIMNSGGVTVRQFSLGYSASQGMGTLRVHGAYIYICALFYNNGYNTFVEKRNLLTGQLVWRREFMKAFRGYMDTDENGNAYIGMTIDSTTYWPFGMVALNQNNSIMWQKYSRPNYSDASNKENYVNGIAVSSIKGSVILIGECENDSLSNTGKQVGYFMGRNFLTGDSLFSAKIANHPSAPIDHFNGIVFDSLGYFYIAGKWRQGTNTCFLKKYYIDVLTGVNENHETPEGFSLLQNYPNPFNPSTTIEFSIPKKTLVTIKVYDVLGKEIQTLVNEIKTMGSYSVDFNGSNLSSGIYFYRIETPDFSETRKMILTK